VDGEWGEGCGVTKFLGVGEKKLGGEAYQGVWEEKREGFQNGDEENIASGPV